MSDINRIEAISREIAALRGQLENARTSWLIKQRDPVARLLDTTTEATLAAQERRISELEAEREKLFEEVFKGAVGEKAKLEQKLKEARRKALEFEWFCRLSPADRLARLGVMQKDVDVLKRELSTFEV